MSDLLTEEEIKAALIYDCDCSDCLVDNMTEVARAQAAKTRAACAWELAALSDDAIRSAIWSGLNVYGPRGGNEQWSPPSRAAYDEAAKRVRALFVDAVRAAGGGGRRSRSPWFDMAKHGNSVVLYACATAGLTAEQALDELAKREAQLLDIATKLSLMQPPAPIVLKVGPEDDQ